MEEPPGPIQSAGVNRWMLAALGVVLGNMLLIFWQVWHEAGPPDFAYCDFQTYVSPDHQALQYQDFTSHYRVAQQVWKGRTDRPYSEAGYRALLSGWLGFEPGSGLAYAYSPVQWMLVGPWGKVSARTAYVFYFLAMAALVVWWARVLDREKPDGVAALWLLMIGTSLSFQNNLHFGQTAWATTTLFAWFWLRVREGRKTDGVWEGLLLYAACAKPNVALLSVVLLWGGKRWKPLLLAGVLVLGTLFFWEMRWGGQGRWLLDYVDNLGRYNWQDIPPWMKDSLVPRANTHLAAALQSVTWIEQRTLVKLSALLFFAGLVWAAWKGPRRGAVVLVFSLLLFSPNLMHTEDVLLIVLPLIVAGCWHSRWVWVLVLLAVNGNQINGLLASTVWALVPLAFLAKLTLAAGLMVRAFRPGPADSER